MIPSNGLTTMQTYDILMLIILASAAIFGAIKGFAWQIASLASIVVSYFVAHYFRYDLAKHINAQEPWNVFLAMLLLFFGTSLAIWLIFRMISSSIDKIRLKEFDRQLGAGFGLIKGAVMCCVVTMFAMTLLGPNQKTAIARSRSGQYISKALAHAGSIMPTEVKQVIGPYIANVERELEQGRAGEGFPVPVDFQGANGGQPTAGGILDRFLGKSPRNLPATGPTNTQPGPTNTWYGNDILPANPPLGSPNPNSNQPIPNQPVPNQPPPNYPSNYSPNSPAGVPVLPPLPF